MDRRSTIEGAVVRKGFMRNEEVEMESATCAPPRRTNETRKICENYFVIKLAERERDTWIMHGS
jgi:hypothetical protein